MAQATKLASSLSSICVMTPLSGNNGISSRKRTSFSRYLNLSGCKQTISCQMTGDNYQVSTNILDRRSFAFSVSAAVIATVLDTKEALAGKRKAPAEEENKPKDDPNLSGVQKKVIASIKRKEAMKASLEKLKEKGKMGGKPDKDSE